jgi:hypothetical protein
MRWVTLLIFLVFTFIGLIHIADTYNDTANLHRVLEGLKHLYIKAVTGSFW